MSEGTCQTLLAGLGTAGFLSAFSGVAAGVAGAEAAADNALYACLANPTCYTTFTTYAGVLNCIGADLCVTPTGKVLTAAEIAAQEAAQGGRFIVFDGKFYSADGFKFSKSYYEYLWSSGGRKAPFLQAREILNSNPQITPDPRGAAGYFRYEAAGLEMIYNPTTGQVGHIQPLRK